MFLEEVSPDVLPPLLPGVCVVVGGGVGDDNGLRWGGAWMYRHRSDDACGGMLMAWAEAAVTGSPSVGVIVALP